MRGCQKKTVSNITENSEITEKAYEIECELGGIATKAHRAKCINQVIYDSSAEFLEETASREKFKSSRFMELALDFSTDMSDRKGASRLNRIRLEQKGISPTTYRNTVEREGKAIQKDIERKCEKAICKNGFDVDVENGVSCDFGFKTDESKTMELKDVRSAADELEIKEFDLSEYELQESAVNISVDDVCVKKQSDVRPKEEESTKKRRVNNTVVHVESDKGDYILNASSLFSALKMLIGFLLHHSLLGHQLIFFADGAKDIHKAIPIMFCLMNYKIILDWYHLKKKFQEQLSMALKGSKLRNEFLEELLPFLWYGNVSGAITLLRDIDRRKVRNYEVIEKLIEYLGRVRKTIPCYALRKQLGLRTSSNLGEKANDRIVANRQKHNGMSWSDDGSVAFATVSASFCNNEVSEWVYNHTISLQPVKKAA